MQATHHAVGWHRFVVLHEVDTMPKDGRYLLVKFPLREALEEVATWVFEYSGLNDEHTRDICLYYFHKRMSKLYIVCPQADCFGERELPGINREFKEMGPQADGGGEQQLSKIGQQLKENNFVPWMISSPNKKCNQI